MLQKLRDKSSGWLATTVLGILVVPFAFFGMEQYLFQNNDTFAAKIEAPPAWWPSAPAFWPVTMLWQRDEIGVEEFRNQFAQARQQQRAQQGDAFDSAEFESIDNKRKVLDSMVDQRVLRMAVDRNGITVGDAQVRAEIENIPAFQVDGKFNAQQYQVVLQSQVPPRSPREFQEDVRASLKQSLIPTQVADSSFVTDAELDRLLRLTGETRDVSFVVLNPPAADATPVTDAQVRAWYSAHASAYRAPETVTLEYVDLDASKLVVPAPTEDALRQRYQQQQEHAAGADQRLASHILVKVDAGANEAAWKAAEAKAKKIAEQARQPGADFAALARADSDDDGSKASGGDLGWVEKGAMTKPFEDALFAMQAGQVSEPVRTEFGWHVIQLREIKTGTQATFEQMHDQLAKEQADSDRDRAYNDLTGKVVDEVLKNPTTLAAAAKLAGQPVQQLGPIARNAKPDAKAGLAGNAAVLREAFKDSLVEDGTASDPIEVGPGHSVLVRVLQHTPERALKLDEVRDRVVAAIRADRAAKTADAAAEAMLADVRAGKPLQDLATASKLPIANIPGVPRGAPVPDIDVADAMFAAPAPAGSKPSAGKARMADGRFVVFTVGKVTPGDPAQATPEQRIQMRQQIADAAGYGEAMSLVKDLRKKMKITVSESQL
ncbi:peptidylprolyl isomerase [Pseudoluteimonas lycopersici]|uniref:Periplasmic chaperone PpiD n=1 Tax=Pseudoluteimonas lycopersici TaxID=1324796 RepID=A0A516V237_9GAMM|nr:SurA N-terminal domain-containing protein [Lysobacter lycopersici]QDQ72587.1 peptidylprolyl isomerase [Lysobacter lycopersici]